MHKWETKEQKTQKFYTCKEKLTTTLNNKSIWIVAQIKEKNGQFTYEVRIVDDYIRLLPDKVDYTRVVLAGERQEGTAKALKEFLEQTIDYECHRCEGKLFDHNFIYDLYNENLKEIVAYKIRDKYYKAIGLQSGLSGNIMIYGNGEASKKINWKLENDFPIKITFDDDEWN